MRSHAIASTSPVRSPPNTPIANATLNGSVSAWKTRRTSASVSMKGVSFGSWVGRMRRRVERGRLCTGFTVTPVSRRRSRRSE
jgi:hypothetical protein